MANLKLVKSATALVLGASVLTSAVAVSGTDASAKTTYKVTKKGYLVNAKTNKAVKGYKSYKGKLYKNGKKLTGTYKSVFYKSGVKFTGTYNKKYYVKGKLFTGKTSKNVYYKKGVKFTGVTSYGYTYKDGKRVEGEYKGKVYKNGKLVTGVYKDVLYTKGVKETGLDLYKEKLYKDGVLNVGLALFQDKLYKDAGLANGVIEFNNDTNAYENGVVVPTSVASASAVNQSEITLSGAALGKVKASDITVAGAEVTSVTPSADWKTATVKLNGTLAANKDTKVSVKVGTETKDLTVNYAFGPKAVAVQTNTFDDDTAKQKLTVLVDGVATPVDYLLSAGYKVEFNAYDSKGDLANTKFFGTTLDAASTTGVLNAAGIDKDNYTVTVVISSGSTILTSEKANIAVVNLDNAATTISNYELVNGVTTNVQNSSTLVVNETATLGKITLGVGSNKTEIQGTNPVVNIKSSDESVISVGAGNVLTANKMGTATLTVTIGKVTKQITLTVKGAPRTASTVVVSNQKILVGKTNNVKVLVKDQYGDALGAVLSTDAKFYAVIPSGISGLTVADTKLATDADGYATLALSDATTAGQSGTVVIKKVSDDSVVDTFTLTTTADDAATSTKLGYASTSLSTDDVIDAELASDNSITYQLNTFNKDGVKLSSGIDLEGYKVKFNGKIVNVDGNKTGEVTLASGDTEFNVAIEDAGSTTLAIYDKDNKLVDQKTITVKTAGAYIEDATWKTTSTVTYTNVINYKTVLDIAEGTATTDDIVKGIKLSSPVVNNIRIYTGKAETTDATADSLAKGNLYIDRDDSGTYTSGDDIIGTVTVAPAAGSTGLTAPEAITGASVTTGTPAKGSLIFSVKVGDTFVSQTSVNVDVK